jgi:hypothetical protein
VTVIVALPFPSTVGIITAKSLPRELDSGVHVVAPLAIHPQSV